MAYIGKQPTVGNFVKLDAITTSATTTFNLTNGGVAYYPQSPNHCIVSLNGVIQSPTSAYTISGSTIVFSDALTSSDTIDFILVLGDVLNIGTPSDGTITSAKLASGVSGLISWQSVQTTGFTAVAGRGYPCNTTSAAFTVTLPASPSAGDTIILLDYAGTWNSNVLTINPNGNKILGQTSNVLVSKNREAIKLTYIDSTQGWLPNSGYQESTQGLAIPYSVDFLVIAGGGSGGQNNDAGGGGAGGYRSSNSTYGNSGGGASAEASLTFNPGTVYTITVGAGGANTGANGSNSSISGTGLTTITSTGGGKGGNGDQASPGTGSGSSGGSGGGGGYNNTNNGGSGTANQGYAGGGGEAAPPAYRGGGGGGAGEAGNTDGLGEGGDGVASTITGSSVTRAGGGGGGADGSTTPPTGGTGGGGNGANSNNRTGGTATVNTGSGGGGLTGSGSGTAIAGAGGSGVVILRMPTANYSGTTTGSPTVTTSGSDTILTFNASGSYTA